MEQVQTVVTLLFELLRQLAAGADEDPSVELPLAQLRVCRVLYQGPRPMSPLSRELGVSLSRDDLDCRPPGARPIGQTDGSGR